MTEGEKRAYMKRLEWAARADIDDAVNGDQQWATMGTHLKAVTKHIEQELAIKTIEEAFNVTH